MSGTGGSLLKRGHIPRQAVPKQTTHSNRRVVDLIVMHRKGLHDDGRIKRCPDCKKGITP